ncbi:MAG: 1-(5-phosphoribosyl)-5-[(5-phosphoribosylamino)methylideneamino] imidazole-4-carboxamide isomerase [Ignavibacteriaceae bacterium]|nr:1-(5-phosphoribosyl)-5-[(5-phosphoribosylamino)methylideneamino] imidazole-4-carboxamide isomerase [Ignavibacteriaceae bacterium]
MNSHKLLLVIPSIDIKNGKTVRVVQGIPELDCEQYGDDPVEMAKIWRAENAKILHVVDFDGIVDKSRRNLPLMKKMCSSVVIPIEYAGRIATIDDANSVFDCGVYRIVIGTMAIENFDEFKKLFELYGPTKIVVAIDVIDNELVSRGRRIKAGIPYIDFAKKIADLGVQRFVVTDVKRNGVLGGPNIQLSKEIAVTTNSKVTHSGGVRNKDELMDLQNLIPFGIDSVIVGRALYENRFPCQKLWRLAESGIFN